jgi:hypothetical protein
MILLSDKGTIWENIIVYALARPRADRWTRCFKIEEIALTEKQALLFFKPQIKIDEIIFPQGSLTIKLNRFVSYETSASSSLRWLKPRKIMAVRVKLSTRRIEHSPMGKYPYVSPESILKMDHTWFFERVMYAGSYYWRENEREGRELLARMILLKELRFD